MPKKPDKWDRLANTIAVMCRGQYGWTIVLYGIEVDGTTRKRDAEWHLKRWRQRIASTLRVAAL